MNNLISKILRPYKYCFIKGNLIPTFIWLLSVIVGGLIVVILNCFLRCSQGESLCDSLSIDLENGLFLSFSFYLLISVLYPMAIELYRNKHIDFRNMKWTVLLSSILMIVIIIFCVFLNSNKKLPDEMAHIIICTISILLAFYSLGLSYIEENKSDNIDINDSSEYGATVYKEIRYTEDKLTTLKITKNGIKL